MVLLDTGKQGITVQYRNGQLQILVYSQGPAKVTNVHRLLVSAINRHSVCHRILTSAVMIFPVFKETHFFSVESDGLPSLTHLPRPRQRCRLISD